MKCPYCGSEDVEAVKSWEMPKRGYKVTRYRCRSCGGQFNHYVGRGKEFVLRPGASRKSPRRTCIIVEWPNLPQIRVSEIEVRGTYLSGISEFLWKLEGLREKGVLKVLSAEALVVCGGSAEAQFKAKGGGSLGQILSRALSSAKGCAVRVVVEVDAQLSESLRLALETYHKIMNKDVEIRARGELCAAEGG
ncbi:hypothetical protein Pogu_0503 [Pyrobaculum oguniense TE7]|uniref:Uncharacterized protein n=1 Tax=Pyrobaculum oguniense (strain DSM 13380 / JCM 10595 / TE7) TaxID=698757 RepID=H6Q766_PYROT|nr:hypothetical protein Pogu_0503 [Pyrobaculum oguniense TE7]